MMKRSLCRRKDAGAIHKNVTCDAGPQTAALPNDDGVQKTNDDRIAYLEQHTKGICGIGKIYNMSYAKGHSGNDDGAVQIVFCHSPEQKTSEYKLLYIAAYS